MIGAISGLGIGQASGASSLQDIRNATPASAARGFVSQGIDPLGMNQASTLQAVATQVGQLLQGIGGGMEDNKTLQTIVALLILVALLGEMQKQQDAATDMLTNLARSSHGASAYSSFSASQVTIEKTSLTITSAQSLESFTDAGQTSAQGQQLDVAA